MCAGCRGKFPLLLEGGFRCEVCASLFRLEHLVRGARFPQALGVTAVRHLQACYLQLLQEADLHYFQNPAIGPELLPQESKGESAETPSTHTGGGLLRNKRRNPRRRRPLPNDTSKKRKKKSPDPERRKRDTRERKKQQPPLQDP